MPVDEVDEVQTLLDHIDGLPWVITQTDVTLSWLDRLRVLWHGTIHVETRNRLSHMHARTLEVTGRTWVDRLWKRPVQGVVTMVEKSP